MKGKRIAATLCAMLALAALGASSAPAADNKGGEVLLSFHMLQDPNIYEESDYGEPPTLAIWLEDRETGEYRTVYVTYRGATGDFYGKVECHIALPVWNEVYKEEYGREEYPSPRQGAPESVTRATSLDGEINAEAVVPKGREYYYYIEMNVAGDFNETFPFQDEDNRLDHQANGQPSLVYRGEITSLPGESSSPGPIGRTLQHQLTTELVEDLEGMDTALQCLSEIEVTCKAR